MKAEIIMDPATKAGILKITPETQIEAFALHHWYKNYSSASGGDGRSIFANSSSIFAICSMPLPSEEVEG